MQAAVDAEVFRDVVILDQVAPGQRWGEGEVSSETQLPHNEIAIGQPDVVVREGQVGAEVAIGAPGDISAVLHVAAVVVLAALQVHVAGPFALCAHLHGQQQVGECVFAGGDYYWWMAVGGAVDGERCGKHFLVVDVAREPGIVGVGKR